LHVQNAKYKQKKKDDMHN